MGYGAASARADLSDLKDLGSVVFYNEIMGNLTSFHNLTKVERLFGDIQGRDLGSRGRAIGSMNVADPEKENHDPETPHEGSFHIFPILRISWVERGTLNCSMN